MTQNLPHPFNCWLRTFRCSSFPELYSMLEFISKHKMSLDRVPFSISDLEHPNTNDILTKIFFFMEQCAKANNGDNSEAEAIKLIKFLKKNPPNESYENPKLSETQPEEDEINLIRHIFNYGIDLPGSMHNLFGHLQLYGSWFIDIFFGNYTEFIDYVKSLSKEELAKALKKREGYCQFSPIFAPILGLNLVDLEDKVCFTSKEKNEIRTMYSGNNENKHLKIFKKLIKLGADVNAHDIYGYTPLHFAVFYNNSGMVTDLLKHGANPNSESRNGERPLSIWVNSILDETDMIVVDSLIQHDAKLMDKKHTNDLRTAVETYGSNELISKVRIAHPRDKKECEKCMKPAPKQCSACKTVYYCTPACQKMDWRFHKVTCQKK